MELFHRLLDRFDWAIAGLIGARATHIIGKLKFNSVPPKPYE